MSRKAESATPAGIHEGDDVREDAPASTDDNLTSSQEDGQQEPSLLDAIEEAVGGSTEDEMVGEEDKAEAEEEAEPEGDEPKEGEEPGEGKAEPEGKAEADQESEEDDGKDVKPGQQIPYERFQKVVHQKNSFRDERDTALQERDQYKQGHENFQAIQNFRERNNLSDTDVVQALQIAASINNDPVRALEQLRPLMDRLQLVVGEKLPDDLQLRVDQGELSEQDAKELVRTRNENARLQQQNAQAQQAQEQQQNQAQLQEWRQSLAAAASAQEKQLKQKDPEYDKKAPLVQRELRLLMTEKPPRAAEDAVSLVREAYDNVNRHLASLTRRPAVPRGPSSQGQGGTGTASEGEPKSMLEAMERSLAGQ